MYLIDDTDISNLQKARAKFEMFRLRLDTEQNKAGAIQAFEFCYELSWKTMKRFCEKSGRTLYTFTELEFSSSLVASIVLA